MTKLRKYPTKQNQKRMVLDDPTFKSQEFQKKTKERNYELNNSQSLKKKLPD